VNAGVDVKVKDNSERTAFDYARLHGHTDVFEILLSRQSRIVRGEGDRTEVTSTEIVGGQKELRCNFCVLA